MEKVKFIYLDVGDTLIHLKNPAGKIYYDILKYHNVIEESFDTSILKKSFSDSWNIMTMKNPPDYKCRYTNHPNGNDGFWRELIGIFLTNFGKESLTEKIYLDIVNTFNDPNSWLIDLTFFSLYEKATLRNIQLGIISNWDLRLRNLLKNMGLLNYFQHVIISSEFGYEKPSEKIFKEAMRKVNLEGKNLIYIGDKPQFDYYPPKNLGWKTFILSSKQKEGIDIIKKLSDLENFF